MSAIKQVIPRSSGKHRVIVIDYKNVLTGDKPHKPLLKKLQETSGRNNTGKITVRHRGGRAKRLYRMIDFKRDKLNVPGVLKTIEYDPYRTALIGLVWYKDGEKRYILLPAGLKVEEEILSSNEQIDIKPGNTMPIGVIPDGTFIHNIEITPGRGGQLERSAGALAQILGKDLTGNFTIVKLTSKENRKIPNNARATVGQVSNIEHNLVMLGKAGRKRHLGFRPTVRGSAMNPNDHAHGGGEGRCPIGRDAPRTPWGKKHMGVKTRKKNKWTNTLIVKSRHLNK